MARILVVDDELKIRDMIEKYATHSGHHVGLARDGVEALKLYEKNKYDIVIMDVMMPNMDGYKTLEKMKEIDKDVHCIFLTALGKEYDRVYGLNLGAEDYLTKPFSLKELMLRINVMLKRDNKKEKETIIRYHGITIDDNSMTVTIDGEEVIFARKEYQLLKYLIENKGKVVTREELFSNIWGYDYDSNDRTIDTHIKLIRKKIGKYETTIKTLRGTGFRIEKDD